MSGTDGGGDVPIACSLSGDDVTARVDEWRRLLDGVTERHPLPDGIRLELRDRDRIGELAGLVEAEQACCPFFSFAITVDRRGLALEVTSPPDGHDILIDLFGRAETH